MKEEKLLEKKNQLSLFSKKILKKEKLMYLLNGLLQSKKPKSSSFISLILIPMFNKFVVEMLKKYPTPKNKLSNLVVQAVSFLHSIVRQD